MNPILSIVGPRRVRVSRTGVALFNAPWPCSKLQTNRAYWFEFDERGQLTDSDVPEQDDGPEALALGGDCLAWLDDGTSPDWAPEGVESVRHVCAAWTASPGAPHE